MQNTISLGSRNELRAEAIRAAREERRAASFRLGIFLTLIAISLYLAYVGYDESTDAGDGSGAFILLPGLLLFLCVFAAFIWAAWTAVRDVASANRAISKNLARMPKEPA